MDLYLLGPAIMSAARPRAKPDGEIICTNLQVRYRQHVAIEGLSGLISPGTMTAIVGPNGGGKSTLLKAMAGFIVPCSGTLSMGTFTRRHIAYLPQQTAVDRSFPLRVHDVVAMGLYPEVGFFRKFPRDSVQRIQEALGLVGMADFADRPLYALSGGQFQRILFARMALQEARLILLDEPFAAIDAPTMDLLAQLLVSWQSVGKTIVAVLHDMDIVRNFFPQTLVLARRCVAWGATAETLTPPVLEKAKVLAGSWGECSHSENRWVTTDV